MFSGEQDVQPDCVQTGSVTQQKLKSGWDLHSRVCNKTRGFNLMMLIIFDNACRLFNMISNPTAFTL